MANLRLMPCVLASVIACSMSVSAQQIAASTVDTTKLMQAGQQPATTKSNNLYIVELKRVPAVGKAVQIGELRSDSRLTTQSGNQYNPNSSQIQDYIDFMQAEQARLAIDIGNIEMLYQYTHTFNGFSAKLSPSQVKALRNHPDVANVYQDQMMQVQTANTPAFLGLTAQGGQHPLNIKGEDVIVGILDTGIDPASDSFADDDNVPAWSYGPAPARWQGECNVGSIGEFVNADGQVVYNDESVTKNEVTCNDKLIGGRYFGNSFSSVNEIRFALGEFASIRDADTHGSHVAGTAAGNAEVNAVANGVDLGTVSGIAPRARVAAYKVCWNSGFINEAGEPERGCFFGDSMAAIDAAVADGVDVLNYSIGNSNVINSPVYNAALRATEAGVFFSASGGNSGPGPDTVGNIAPWVATVAASTYDGVSKLVGDALEVNLGDGETTSLFSIHATIGPQIPETGLSGTLMLATPQLACEAITNDLTGKIALIERGTCAFTTKISNAANAGAIGAVVFTDNRTPIAMGRGDDDTTEVTIPSVMITRPDGLSLVSLLDETDVDVAMTYGGASQDQVEVGNVMAGFSSRGVNPQTGDILKPDFTAPGVRILAAISPEQMDIPGNFDGVSFDYLQGTSMSSPHVAGMAALLMGQYPSWTPAEVKSALMTTARQDVVKEDGTTPATPFDFGAGHVAPVAAMTPGLVYPAGINEFLGFLCGFNENTLVSGFGSSCAELDGQVPFDASQLNYPSISIADLSEPEVISRTVKDVTGAGGTYTISVDAPAGIDVVPMVNGEMSSTLTVPENGTATYELMVAKGVDVNEGEWAFGSVTLSPNDGMDVRSPIAVKPDTSILIDVPPALALDLNRGRGRFAVQMNYSGSTSIEYKGLTPGFDVSNVAPQSPGFDFIAGLERATFFTIPEGSTAFRVTLDDTMISPALVDDGTGEMVPVDLDLLLYRCTGFSCANIANSFAFDTDEEIFIIDPEGRNDADNGDLYILFVDGFFTGGVDVAYTMPVYVVDSARSTTRMRGSRRAINGRFNNINISTRGLVPNRTHMGSVTFFDGENQSQGTTILLVEP